MIGKTSFPLAAFGGPAPRGAVEQRTVLRRHEPTVPGKLDALIVPAKRSLLCPPPRLFWCMAAVRLIANS